ncbi:hypothetical protein MCHI_003781 [Candidatus Magnetoovum chiemensis]|nr:hypothetical protein MCHI_003781 [Candidatus Magnetoovum chiemensis]
MRIVLALCFGRALWIQCWISILRLIITIALDISEAIQTGGCQIEKS